MSHFYGTMQGARGVATRCATKSSGLVALAAGWKGAVRVVLTHNDKTGADEFVVSLVPWKGSGGEYRELARGVLDATTVRA